LLSEVSYSRKVPLTEIRILFYSGDSCSSVFTALHI